MESTEAQESTTVIASNGDVILVVGPQSVKMRVHSHLLRSVSRVFAAMFGALLPRRMRSCSRVSEGNYAARGQRRCTAHHFSHCPSRQRPRSSNPDAAPSTPSCLCSRQVRMLNGSQVCQCAVAAAQGDGRGAGAGATYGRRLSFRRCTGFRSLELGAPHSMPQIVLGAFTQQTCRSGHTTQCTMYVIA